MSSRMNMPSPSLGSVTERRQILRRARRALNLYGQGLHPHAALLNEPNETRVNDLRVVLASVKYLLALENAKSDA